MDCTGESERPARQIGIGAYKGNLKLQFEEIESRRPGKGGDVEMAKTSKDGAVCAQLGALWW